MKIVCVLTIFLLSFHEALSTCNTCLTTGAVACFSHTQYFSCSGTTINISNLKTCPATEVCGDVIGGCSTTVTDTACDVVPQMVTPAPTPSASCAVVGKVLKFVENFILKKFFTQN